jgi:hypothetical protein
MKLLASSEIGDRSSLCDHVRSTTLISDVIGGPIDGAILGLGIITYHFCAVLDKKIAITLQWSDGRCR